MAAPKNRKYVDFLTENQIEDIKGADAWPVDAFMDHKNPDDSHSDEVTSKTFLFTKWEDGLWVNDGSEHHLYLRKRLQKEEDNGKVEWADTVIIGDTVCTQVRWKSTWVPIHDVILECGRGRNMNKLRMYCVRKGLKWEDAKKFATKNLH